MTQSATSIEVAITGMGLVTPLGNAPAEILERIARGDTAFQPVPFAPATICPQFAPVPEFDAAQYFPDNKTLRLMNRDAQMAVVAARLAMQDAGLASGALYPAEEIALYGATGLSGMPSAEIASLLQHATAEDGSLDLQRFGQVALRRIRPVLSFKILANMPICFVSIFENLRGPNAVYTPWEGQGAEAIAAGLRAVGDGDAPCAVVGACDVKTHALSFLGLQQLGVLDSWQRDGSGSVPGEGAAFLVLERRDRAMARGARVYACLRRCVSHSLTIGAAAQGPGSVPATALTQVLRGLDAGGRVQVVLAGDGDPLYAQAESAALEAAGATQCKTLRPKAHLGNLFAAAAPVQVALAALLAHEQPGTPVVANCFGHGTEQAALVVEAA